MHGGSRVESRGRPRNTLVIHPGESMKVLVAIDGWNEGHAAVDALARQQLPQGSEIRVISVVEPMRSYAGAGMEIGVFDGVAPGDDVGE